MQNEHDLAYDSVLRYLEANDPAEADKLKADNEALNFKEMKNKDFRSFTDDQLTDFLKEAGKHSRHFKELGQ